MTAILILTFVVCTFFVAPAVDAYRRRRRQERAVLRRLPRIDTGPRFDRSQRRAS